MLTPSQQDTSDALRYAGLTLQLAGIGLAALGIRNVRREWTERLGIVVTSRRLLDRWFGVTGAFLREMWRRVTRRPKHVTIYAETAHLTLSPIASRATVTLGPPPPGRSTEERLTWLEQRVADAFNHAETTRQALTDEIEARNAALEAERTARNEHAEEVRQSIGRLAGGGLALQTWGVTCLLVGTVLATIPDQLVRI